MTTKPISLSVKSHRSGAVYGLPNSCDFYKVKNNSSQNNECTPKLGDPFFSNFKGILINGPKNIAWKHGLELDDYFISPKGNRDGQLRVMLAGLLKIPYGTLGIKDDFKYHVLIIAVDQGTSEIFQGKMNRFGMQAPLIDIPGYDDANQGLDSQENFNVDLVHNLGLPIKQASYTVYATLGEYKSNAIEIHIEVN